MTDTLKDHLERLAADAPSLDIPADTWARGRRRHRRAVTVRALGALALVVLLGLAPLLVARLDTGTVQPADPSRSLGVPDRLQGVPARLADRSDGAWVHDIVTDDLHTGVGAAAWVTAEGLPVVVDAAAGGYHLLDLPGFQLTSTEAASTWIGYTPYTFLALSPDGTHLAYGYADLDGPGRSATVTTGIRIVDLPTGEVQRSIPLTGGAGVAVTDISWSSGGTWLAWSGFRTTSWTASSIGGHTPLVGIAGPGRDEQVHKRAPRNSTVSVDDDGAGVVVSGRRLTLLPARNSRGSQAFVTGPTARVPRSIRWSRTGHAVDSALLSPDGTQVAVGADGEGLLVIDVPSGRWRLVADDGPDSAQTRPLAWSGDTLVTDAWREGHHIEAVTVRRPTEPRTLVTLGPGVTPSIATDLLGTPPHTVDRPGPHWPWSPDRWAFTIALTILVVFAVAGAATVVTRRPR
ncbi:WD40 repeat domain-containing protein [Nocardioides acrostichi]|uniref:WD40 repeat domain-containing protein n=1 Tax=Nocardioides acrostichi TaxID=2784339 RepID=A0A930Y8L0_9ACTN|nr:hypothetical protein [Nocardioides acrostichi]MBF4163222.1 hypothetical protein [Nocardioides acrostichi]